ncbi:YicC/YloC family endoribonuclease [Thioalkalivibrio sp. AKL19]|uniref:YicC/YloC family endoribonuclease n=1 Tax=Thioalkalivibrio sp. AKL19 TaxID=1266914 RepID=UPI0004627296|nr:YicC/YloC family endoribonuclease [Thioalkalivibrio sp. AKL19]
MINSMTGFSRHAMTLDAGVFDWELKSVNHRYLELRIHLPDHLRSLEGAVRNRLKGRLARGKVDAVLRDRGQADSSPEAFDPDRAQALIGACMAIERMMRSPAPVSPLDVLRWPGVLQGAADDGEALAEPLLAGFDTALDALVGMRTTEGAALADGMRTRLDALAGHARSIRARRQPMLDEQRSRILARIHELDLNLDPKRLEQEVALLAQRMDIAEELDRIDGHVAAVHEILDLGGPSGRRLDFLMQEFNREANTISSKSHDLEITRATVEMKVLIEQLREQVQNLE